jgi:protein required for attachment to host cells
MPWIVIADGQKARIMRRSAAGARTLESVLPFDLRNDALLDRPFTDAPAGKASVSALGDRRHAMDAHEPPRRALKRAFAERTAHYLSDAVAQGACKGLILIAAPATLGDLRRSLSPAAQKVILQSLDKDLVDADEEEIVAHLDQLN